MALVTPSFFKILSLSLFMTMDFRYSDTVGRAWLSLVLARHCLQPYVCALFHPLPHSTNTVQLTLLHNPLEVITVSFSELSTTSSHAQCYAAVTAYIQFGQDCNIYMADARLYDLLSHLVFFCMLIVLNDGCTGW